MNTHGVPSLADIMFRILVRFSTKRHCRALGEMLFKDELNFYTSQGNECCKYGMVF